MTEVFFRLLKISLYAGWLVLAILLLRLVLRRWPKWVFPALWSLVGIRLLLPVSVLSRFSLLSLFSSESVEAYAKTADAASGLQSFPAVGFVWIVGAAALLLYGLFSVLLLRRKLQTAVLQEGRVYRSEYARSPFILGLFAPRIYLPFSLSAEASSHVIAHEKAHVRRLDHWWKPIGYVLLCVYWFHPLLWLTYFLLCRDLELACDERVIRSMTEGERTAYSQTLLNCSANRRLVPACPLSFGGNTALRVRSILCYQKRPRWMAFAAIALAVVLAACFLTDPAVPVSSESSERLQTVQKVSDRFEEEPADPSSSNRFPTMRLPENAVVLTEEQAKQNPLCDLFPEIRDAETILIVTGDGDTLIPIFPTKP